MLDLSFDVASGDRLHDAFVMQASITPDAVALQHCGRSYTYSHLNARSNYIASLLESNGVSEGSTVGVYLRRDIIMIASIIAILKTGASYVPFDPEYPIERNKFILEDSKVGCLIADPSDPIAGAYGGKIIDPRIEAATDLVSGGYRNERRKTGPKSNVACIIYTSGSTGKPKGVVLGHSAVRMIAWARNTFVCGELLCVAATTSVCFDPSIFEIFAPLSSGGRILLKENLLDPFTADEQPSMLNGVPTAFAELVRRNAIPAPVKVVNVGGERLRADLAKQIYQSSHVKQVWNHYGPTEATICTTVSLVDRDATLDPAIGEPIAEASLFILDEEGKPVKRGETGELFIGGPNLAYGYLNLPQMTSDRFHAHPDLPSLRLYRTGDLVKRNDGNEIHFVGRVGRQVKIRGFRIELDDVESIIATLPGVNAVAVKVTEDSSGKLRLASFVVSNTEFTISKLRQALKLKLPEHMLPSSLTILQELPKTATGKVDYSRLIEASVTKPDYCKSDRPPINAAIIETFRSVLRQGNIGEDDNFFDIGGDSLMALEVAERLEAMLGLSVPVSIIYHGPTAAELAELIQLQGISHSNFVRLQTEGSGIPLFCLPDIYGRPTSFISIAKYFAGDRKVYGLAAGDNSESFFEESTISALTRGFISTIRDLKPSGPYYILGYSAGGIPAIDLAASMADAGEEVILVLIDPMAQRFITDWQNMKRQIKRALIATFRNGPKKGLATLVRLPPPPWAPPAYDRQTRTLLEAEATWRARSFAGTTFLAECATEGGIREKLMKFWTIFTAGTFRGWRSYLSGPFEKVAFPVNHAEIMREPFASELSAWIESKLGESETLPKKGPLAI